MRAKAAIAIARVAALVLLVLVVFGGIPASIALRPVVFEKSATPLPTDDPDAQDGSAWTRDARAVVTTRDEAGHAIAGARVRIFALRREASDTGPVAYAAGDLRTDDGGKARALDLPRGEVWITADADGRARASMNLVLDAGERAIDLVLGPAHALDVEVKDERGTPLVGAEVEIVQADPLPIGARVAERGVAHVTRLGPPPWAVTARMTGYDEVSTRGVREGELLHVVLRRLGAIAVHVVDEHGAKVRGARVQIASPTLWPAGVADADDAGAVRIGALPAGTYALRAVTRDRASAIEMGVTLARGEEKSLTLHLAPSETVAVRVTGDDDASLAGARITLAESGLSPFPIEATTDREGRARLGPIAKGPASLAVRAEGYVPRGVIAVPDPLPGEVAIVLAHAGVIDGRITDVRGFPVDGATIEIVGTAFDGAPIDDDPRRTRFTNAQFAAALAGPRPLIPAGDLGVMPGPVPRIPVAGAPIAGAPPALEPTEPWVTRSDGTYRAAPASPGRVRVLVHHPQYVDASSELATLAPGGTTHLDVVMHAGGTLEGRVLDASGRGVEGARVVLAATRGLLERTARTASDGSFGFAAVPGDVVLFASPDDEGSVPEVRAVAQVPEGGRAQITLRLPAARDPLPARVKDDRGYPVDAAQITVASLDPSSALRETTFTDARGEATVARAKGIPLRAEITAPGRAPAVVTLDAAATALEVTLSAAESATGEVRSTRGDPIAGAEVAFYTDLGVRRARTGDGGAFTLADLAPGHGRLVARADGFARASRDVTIETGGGRRAQLLGRVELAPGGVAEGVVLDARGDPIAGARVAQNIVPTYLAVGATPAGVAVTDARGRFHLAELPEGQVVLEAYAPDSGRARRDVQIAAGETTRDVRFSLVPDDSPRAREPASAGSLAITLGETGDPREVVIAAVAEGSEAERAGLVPGDVVLTVDGATVDTMEQARAKMSGPLGDDVLLTLRRHERSQTLRVPREPVRR